MGGSCRGHGGNKKVLKRLKEIYKDLYLRITLKLILDEIRWNIVD
jgi:hypothetical protein